MQLNNSWINEENKEVINIFLEIDDNEETRQQYLWAQKKSSKQKETHTVAGIRKKRGKI